MNSIRTKFGLICILLLSVVMLIPSANSKYVSRYMTSLTLSTKKPYFNLWYSDTKGVRIPEVGSAEASGAATVANGIITISKATDDQLVDGYYLLIAKGGNGGRGVNTATSAYTDGGYGGIMCGVIHFRPESASQSLIVYLGNGGGDATEETRWIEDVDGNGSWETYDGAFLAGRNAFIKNNGNTFPASGGQGTTYNLSGAGGGAGTWVFLNSNSYANTLMIAGGGGGTAGRTESGGVNNVGGDGGSNIVPGSTEIAVNSGLTGRIFCGFAGAGQYGGTGGKAAEESKGTNEGNMGYEFTTDDNTYWSPGSGGAATNTGGDFSGGGGGGYVGGQGGGYGQNGGGGASSFISNSVSTPSEITSMANYKKTMDFFFKRYGFDLTILDNGKIVFNNNGTPTSEIERFSFFALYYLGTTAPASL